MGAWQAKEGRRLRVLHVASWYPTPGSPVNGVFTRRHVRAVGQECDTAVLHVFTEDCNRLALDGRWDCGVFELSVNRPYPQYRLGPLRKLYTAYMFSASYVATAMRALDTLESAWGLPDIVHAHVTYPGAFAARRIAKHYGVPYLISEHSADYLPENGSLSQRGPIILSLMHRAVRSACLVTVPSENLGTAMLGHGFEATYRVVPNIVPSCPLVSSEHVGQKLILNVNLLIDATKNVSGLIRAIHMLSKSRDDFHLVVVGDGPDRQSLEGLASSLGVLDRHVTFFGRATSDQVMELTAGAQFAVLNSNFETFSVAMAEALSCGKPVVCTRCGGPEEFITEADGILVPRGRDSELAEALARMLDTFDDYDAASIRRRAIARFGSDVVGAQLVSLYRDCLNEAGAS